MNKFMARRVMLWKATRASLWKKLRAMENVPMIPGALSLIGPQKGKRGAIALAERKDGKLNSWYVPAPERAEVRAQVDSYREARDLLAKIARCDLALLKLRVKARKQAEGVARRNEAR